jgi:hypothetical protein
MLALLRSRRWIPKLRKGVAKGMCYSDTLFQDPILDEARQMLDGHFDFNALQINRYDPKRWPGSDTHQDQGNRGESRMLVLGDFEGGAFLMFEKGVDHPPRKISQRYQWIAFNGHIHHGSDPVTAGMRFSVIAFTIDDR